jgi:hypothetical protein
VTFREKRHSGKLVVADTTADQEIKKMKKADQKPDCPDQSG